MRIEASIEIEAKPEAIWQIATDPNLAPLWNPNVTSVANVSPGPVGVGTHWTQTVRIMGRDQEMRGEVVESDPPRRGVVHLTGPGEPFITTTIQPSEIGSILTQTMDLTIPSGLTGVAMRLGIPVIKEQLQEALRRQKSAAEQAKRQPT